ncbi:MAG: hypothetical protein ACI4TV_03305 [Paludibacteraceae bacterium]
MFMFAATHTWFSVFELHLRCVAAGLRRHLLSAVCLLVVWYAGEKAYGAGYSVNEQVWHRVTLSIEGAGGCELPWTKGMKYDGDALPSIENSAAGVAGVGVGYRLAYKHLLFQTGLTAKYGYMVNNPRDSTYYKEQLMDPDNGFHYNLTERFYNRRDTVQNLRVQVPLLLGGEWGRFYFLAGLKLSASVFSPVVRGWLYEGEREYSIFYESIITEVDQDPSHLPPVRYNRSVTMDVMGALEIGGRLNSRDDSPGFKQVPNPQTDCYLAAYAEYALWSSGAFNMLEVGVRLTVQWRIGKKKLCNCMTFDAL